MKKAQIKAQVKTFIFNETLTIILIKYSDYSNIFLTENIAKLPEYTRINDHIIKQEKGKQPFFGLNYSLKPIKFEILKTYIKSNLTNSFIQPFKFFIGVLILFDQKSDKNFHLYMNYQSLYNINIKN